MATFVDTLFVVGFTNDHDQYHEKALELAVSFERQPLITTDAVLLEIGNTLSGRFRQQAIDVINGFFAADEVEIIRLDEALFEKAFDLYKRHSDKSWGLVDCISFIVMKERGIDSALTCDRHFVQAGFRALMLDPIN